MQAAHGLTSVMDAIVVEIFLGRHCATIFGTVMLSPMAGSALGPCLVGEVHDVSGRCAQG
jgi:hypothetical protein